MWSDAARAAAAATRRAHVNAKTVYMNGRPMSVATPVSTQLTNHKYRRWLASQIRHARKGVYTPKRTPYILGKAAAQSTSVRNILRKSASLGRKA